MSKDNEKRYEPSEMGDFDPKIVQHRNPKTGVVERVNPFRVIVDNGVMFYEWPKASGNLWWADRTFAGALNESGRPVRGLGHKKYTPAQTVDQSIAQENLLLKRELKKTLTEIAEIKKEKDLSETHPSAKPKAKAKEKVEDKASNTVANS